MEKSIKTKNMMKAYKEYADARHRYECYPKWDSYKTIRDMKREQFIAEASILQSHLDVIQHRCSARCLSAESILEKFCEIENRLGITKKAMDGISIDVDICAQGFARAYNYTPESTQFKAVYKRGQWEITNIYRTTCTSHAGHINLTDEAKAAIIENMSKIK